MVESTRETDRSRRWRMRASGWRATPAWSGSAIVRRLATEGCELLRADRAELDLRRQSAVKAWMRKSRPDVVIVAAATVGGILANRTRPADFLHDNLMIVSAIVEAAHETGVRKLAFLSSSCVYPRLAPQPIAESTMLTGELEPTNEWYASPRSRARNYVMPTVGSTGATSYPSCPPRSTDPATTSISKAGMSCPRCCVASTRPRLRVPHR